MSGNLEVLEYYKSEHSKKLLRMINLNFCEQVASGLTFNTKELQDSFVFDIKTSECTFYLVPETKSDMNKWVPTICQICGFMSTDSLRELSSASHGPCSSLAGFSSSSQHLLRERKSSALPTSSLPCPPVPLRSISTYSKASAQGQKMRGVLASLRAPGKRMIWPCEKIPRVIDTVLTEPVVKSMASTAFPSQADTIQN
ncbi:hypothetical protein ACRRTK_022971 [Alexandromys fortis]